MRDDQIIIPSIMAEAEGAAAVAEPSLTEAYGDHSLEGESPARKPEEKEPQRNTKLTEERATADALAEAGRQNRPRPKRDQLLSEAYEGVTPDEEAEVLIEEDGLPETLQGFDSGDVAAAMVRLGLTAADLEDQRWVNVLRSELENELGDPEDSEGEEGDESEQEDAEEEKKDETKPEEKPEEKKAPVHVELQPEQVKEYVAKTWERAEQVSSPQMSKLFADSLATALGTPPEQRELLDNVVGLLNYGGVSLVQSAVPALVTEYMQQNIMGILDQTIEAALESKLPGLKSMHSEAIISNTWSDVLAMDEFKNSGLPAWEDRDSFNAAAEKVHKDNPWLSDWDPGKNIPVREALKMKAILTARLLKGESFSPAKKQQLIADALVTGKRSAERSTRRVSASRMLGRGKTEGTMGTKAERSSLLDAYNAQHSRDGGIV